MDGQAEGTARTKALEVGGPALGKVDPVSEELSLWLERFWRDRDRKGPDTTVSCDPRLTVRMKSKVQGEAITVSGREVPCCLWLHENIFLKHFKHEKRYNGHSSTAQH